MPNHSLRSDYNAERMRGEAARLPALQRRYALAIAQLYDGDDIDAVAKASDVQPHTVRRWMHVFNEEGIAGFGNAIIGGTYDLRRDFNAQSVRAQAEKAYSPATKVRLFAIAQMYEGVPTREIARLAGVSEGRLSEWRQTFNTAKMIAQGEIENRQLQANARVGGNYWTADKVAASIQKAWDDDHRRKLEVVKLSVEGKSVEAIAQMTGSTRADIVTWIRVFEAGGPKALLPAEASDAPGRPRKRVAEPQKPEISQKVEARGQLNPSHTPEEIAARAKKYGDKTQAARLMSVAHVYRGLPVSVVAERRGVSTSAVRDWLGNFKSRGFDAFPDAVDLASRRNSVPIPPAARKATNKPKVLRDAIRTEVRPVVPKEPDPTSSTKSNEPDHAPNAPAAVKRGPGRPRKFEDKGKSAFLLSRMADGIKSTVKRFTKDVRMVDIQEEDSEPTSRERVEIPFTTSHIQYFLKEALGDEHTLRLKCMLALREGMPMTRIAAANGATISEIRGWRDALAKAGPVALIPKDAIEPFRPKLSAQQATVLNALKFDQPDGKGKTAKALLMLDNNGYPPFVAECVQATVKDLRAWVCNVEAYAGPRAAEGSSWTHSSAGVQEKAHVVTGTTGLSDFQRQVLDVVVQARGVRGEAAIARVARRNDIPLQVVEKWLDKVKRHGSDGLLAETAATPVRMPETSSAKELRGLALTVSQPAANELRALAYIYDGASIATSARICMMSKDDLSELVLDFNMFGLEALGFTGDQPMAMAVGM